MGAGLHDLPDDIGALKAALIAERDRRIVAEADAASAKLRMERRRVGARWYQVFAKRAYQIRALSVIPPDLVERAGSFAGYSEASAAILGLGAPSSFQRSRECR